MDIPTPDELVRHYEAFCKRHDMAETRFGREATGEPQLIQSIRNGRSPSLNVLNRVKAYIADKDEGLPKADWPLPSADNVTETIGGGQEADSPSPFPEGSASGLTSSSTCPSCGGSESPATHPCSTGAEPVAEAAE